MRRERLYLQDIAEAALAIHKFITGIGRDEFFGNDLVRSAVLQKLIIIGEAAARLPREIKDRYPVIEWGKISGFRNYAVHSYFPVDWGIVWNAANKETPALKESVEEIIRKEFP